jgi:branched-chain amino acid transport system substrate-binding protein
MNTKTLWALGAAIVVALLVATLIRPSQSEAVKIGAILPLTGDLASQGQEARRGAELAQEDAVAKGTNVEVVFEDDAFDATKSASAAHKLTSIDQVSAALTLTVEEAHPAGPIFQNSKTPLLVLWDSNKTITQAGDYVFSNGFSTEKEAEHMAEYAYNTLGLRRVAILGHKDPWVDIAVPAFTARFEQLGGQVVFMQKALDVTQTDYRTPIAQIKAVNPDGVYFVLLPPTLGTALKQSKELGLDVPYMTEDGFIQEMITAAGSAAEGTYFTNIEPLVSNPSELAQKYELKYGTRPIDMSLVSFGYDGVNKVIEAGTKKSFTRSGIRDGLYALLGGQSADRVENVYQIQKGVPVPVTQ